MSLEIVVAMIFGAVVNSISAVITDVFLKKRLERQLEKRVNDVIKKIKGNNNELVKKS